MNLTHQGTGEPATSQRTVKRGKLDVGHDVKKSEHRLLVISVRFIHLSREFSLAQFSPHCKLCFQCMYQTELVWRNENCFDLKRSTSFCNGLSWTACAVYCNSIPLSWLHFLPAVSSGTLCCLISRSISEPSVWRFSCRERNKSDCCEDYCYYLHCHSVYSYTSRAKRGTSERSEPVSLDNQANPGCFASKLSDFLLISR